MKFAFFLLFLLSIKVFAQQNDSIQKLGKDFFDWRKLEQPITGDDIPRIERPDGWIADFSPKALQKYENDYNIFNRRLKNLSRLDWTTADSLDYLLLRSAIARVNWELNILKLPEKDPDFYVHQSAGSVYELLVVSSPMDSIRERNIILRINSIPLILKYAELNLNNPIASFTDIALEDMDNINENLSKTELALEKIFPSSLHNELKTSFNRAELAFDNYAKWLRSKRSSMSDNYSVGIEKFKYFLKNIAIIPYTPDQLLEMGKNEFNRAVSFELYQGLIDKKLSKPKLFPNVDAQIKEAGIDELEIRKFLIEKNIMTVPAWVKHYKDEKIPDYVAPLSGLGEDDDFTSPSRLNENCIRYIPNPSPNLSFFNLASAEDPRPIIIHEGVPGHYFQLVQSWKNSDPIRRHYFDSGANEGIGFYFEELMLQFGLFNNSSNTKEIIYRFMRLRALRVEADINLALGKFTIKDAAKYLAKAVPMKYKSAIGEAKFFAQTPGQGMSYQIGKIQIFKFLSDAKLKLGDKFNLKNFHDYLLQNGNVPIALLRWEYLGLNDEVKKFW